MKYYVHSAQCNLLCTMMCSVLDMVVWQQCAARESASGSGDKHSRVAFSQPSPSIDNLGDNDDNIHEENNVDDD